MSIPANIRPSARGTTTSAGMTLVELMVALTLAVALSLLAFNLFAIAQSAARSGFQRSAILQQALAGETRLRNDFASIIGPNRSPNAPAGAVLIIPALRPGTLPVPGHGTQNLLLRSDQIVFFYDSQNGGLTPGASGGAPMTSLTRTGVKSQQAKVWIGHVQPTHLAALPASALEWTLGRQATLLVDPNTTAINTPASLESAPTLATSDPRATFSPANTASLTADVAAFSLEESANWMRGQNPAGSGDANMVAAFAVTPPVTGVYPSNNNTAPTVVTQPLSDNLLDAPDILGGHRMFLPNVSEVVVQYAADLDSDGLMDTTGSPPATGTLRWYPSDADVFNNAGTARAPKVFYPQDDQPRTVHYGYYQGPATISGAVARDSAGTDRYWQNTRLHWTPYPPAGGQNFGDALGAAAYDDAMAAYATHHNGWRPGPALPPAQSKWPQLIRIRYRLHDSDGMVSSVNESFASNGRNDDGDTAPAVIDNASEVRCSGIWFEHIFAVPYPRVN